MRKLFYILTFGFLGLVVSTLLHGLIELIALAIIFGDAQHIDWYVYQHWATVHLIGATVLWSVGLAGGLWGGFYFADSYGKKPGGFGIERS